MVTVVYNTQCGSSKQYAEWLAEGINAECIDFKDAMANLAPGTEVIFVGWRAGPMVVPYKPVSEKFKVIAVVAVGLLEKTDKDMEWIKKKCSIENLFYVRGKMDRSKLSGKQKAFLSIINVKMIIFDRSEEEKRVRQILKNGGDLSSRDQIQPAIDWYNSL